MNPITELHDAAMKLASEAHLASSRGESSDSREKYRQAFEKEKRAALKLKDDLDAEPNRSVLLRSAASLAIICKEYRDAKELVELALGGNPPAPIRDELLELREQIEQHPPARNS